MRGYHSIGRRRSRYFLDKNQTGNYKFEGDTIQSLSLVKSFPAGSWVQELKPFLDTKLACGRTEFACLKEELGFQSNV